MIILNFWKGLVPYYIIFVPSDFEFISVFIQYATETDAETHIKLISGIPHLQPQITRDRPCQFDLTRYKIYRSDTSIILLLVEHIN